MKKILSNQKGVLFTEALVATAVISVIFLAALTALSVALASINAEKLQNQAMFLLQEEIEPLLTVRDSGWANLANGTFYLAQNGASWSLVATTSGETVGQFTRSVTISDVMRDSNGQIVSSGGTVDNSSKKVVGTITWNTQTAHNYSITSYITRYKDNLPWLQTTQADFNGGTRVGTAVTNTNGGEVQLGAGGAGDWCSPQPIAGQVDLDKQGVANAISAIAGRVFAGTGENASGPSFNNVTIPNPPPDPVSVTGTVAGSFDGYKTNGIFGEENYAYLATDTNAKEIVIIDLTQKDANNKYPEAGYFNAPGNGSGNSIYTVGNTGYMTSGNKFYSFSLSANRSGAQTILDSDGVTLAGTGNKIVVIGNYAYIATSSTTAQLQIVEISNPTNLIVRASLALNNQGARDIFVNNSATRAYIATNNSATNPELYIVDVTTKTAPVKITGGTYETGTMSPKGVTVVPGNRALVVGTSGEEYQIVNIADETQPVSCGSLNLDTGVNGIASVIDAGGNAYSYIITGDANSELKIILGGPGGQFASSGTFESSTFSTGTPPKQTAFYRFTANFNEPSQTDLQFQVAGADVGSGGTCATATFTFVGPDGTAGSFFSGASPLTSAVPLSVSGSYLNAAKCFRYKAFFTTSDPTQTPTLFDFTVYYSP